MKKVFVALLFLSSWARAEGYGNIYSNRLRIPFGDTVLAASLAPTALISPVQVQTDSEPSCKGFMVYLEVQYQGDSFWTQTGYSNGYFYTTNRPVAAILFRFRQLNRVYEDCNVRAVSFAPVAPQPGGNPATEVLTLGGTFDFHGGLLQQTVTLNAPFYAQRVEVIIPAFCVGVAVTDLAVVRRGRSILADRVPGKFEIFKLDQPRVFDTVIVGLKGPMSASCTVEFYVYDMAPT